MKHETAGEQEIAAQLRGSRSDRAIAELAERQHGGVSRAQLLGLGLGRGGIRHRLEWGRLFSIHRGVYVVGRRSLTRQGHWMAGVLAAGPGACLSHRCTAALWGLREGAPPPEVTVGRARRSLPGVRIHRSSLPSDEITVREGIPVTRVSRTLLDLATVLNPHQLERAINEAEVRRLTDRLSLPDLLDRYPGRRGTAVVRTILERGRIGLGVTRNDFEASFLAFLDAAGVPRPEVNAHIQVAGRGIEADFLWRRQRLIVELDGHATHSTRRAYESDRERDRRLNAAGWRVVRVTWRQLHDTPDALAADLRTLLRLI